jgi:hypothetical protein
VAVSLNVHGTRAAQKLIRAVRTQEEVVVLIKALRGHVITLIQE